MNISQAIRAVQFRLGNRRDLEEKIRVEFTLIQEEVENSGTPFWYLFQEDVQIATVAGTRKYAYPTRFIQMYDPEAMRIIGADGETSFLESDTRSMLVAAYPGSGQPQAFFDTGSGIEVYPLPDAVYTLHADCFIGDITVEEAFDALGSINAVNKHFQHAADYFVAMAAHRLATSLNNARVAQTALTDAQIAKTRLIRKHTVWEENNVTRSMGDTR